MHRHLMGPLNLNEGRFSFFHAGACLTHACLYAMSSIIWCDDLVPTQLYTQEFYQDILKPRLNPGGIFVTQSGPAGVLTSQEVRLSPITQTMRQPKCP